MAADHGGVGADGLHKGLPHPLQGGLVLRLPHRPLLLGDHRQGEGVPLPRKEQGAAAQDQVVHHIVQGGPPVGRQVVEGPVLKAGKQLLLRDLAQGRVLGQGPEHIVAEPLVPGHAQEVAHRHRPLPVPVEVHRPLHIVHTALKYLFQVFPGKGLRESGLLPGMGGGVCPLRLKQAHGAPSSRWDSMGKTVRAYSPSSRLSPAEMRRRPSFSPESGRFVEGSSKNMYKLAGVFFGEKTRIVILTLPLWLIPGTI